jgi:hypothetical protein
MKRLTLFAVLAASLLAWAAPASAGRIALLYYKSDSIWSRIGNTTNLASNTSGLLSETTAFRHWRDSTGVIKNAGNCVRYWANVFQVRNPNASADTIGTMYLSMRDYPEFELTNDSLAVELPSRVPLGSASAEVNPPIDSTIVSIPTQLGTDSTSTWNEVAIRLGAGTGTTWYYAGRTGRRATFGNAYYGHMAANPCFFWRSAGQFAPGTTPKILYYKIYIYCYKED